MATKRNTEHTRGGCSSSPPDLVQASQWHTGLSQLFGQLLEAPRLLAAVLLPGVPRHVAPARGPPAADRLLLAVGQVYVGGPQVLPQHIRIARCGFATSGLEAAVLLRLIGHQRAAGERNVRPSQTSRHSLHAFRLLATELVLNIAGELLFQHALPLLARLIAPKGQIPVGVAQVARHWRRLRHGAVVGPEAAALLRHGGGDAVEACRPVHATQILLGAHEGRLRPRPGRLLPLLLLRHGHRVQAGLSRLQPRAQMA
mmetsp:Transcript_45149/g.104375  ORF Transcript_45149/g.104375 Transcript_45149/m.104375 type:complete len:257 (+) Transcript_45149:65-835(+)